MLSMAGSTADTGSSSNGGGGQQEADDAAQPSLAHALTQAVHRHAQERLRRERDGGNRGWRRYTEWEQQKWKQQRYDYYEDDLFRCCYAISKLPWSVGISAKALAAASEADPGCARELLACRRAVCLGCGPGSDAIALLDRRCQLNPAAPLAAFLLDRCPGWRSLVVSADEHLRADRLPYSLWFKAGCISDAEGAKRLLPEADLAVLSFAHSVNANPDLWPHLAARYSLVLVIDITSEALAESLQRAGYTACHIESQSAVSVFFYLAARSPSGATADVAESAAAPATVDIAAGTDDAVDAPGDAAGDAAPGAAAGAAPGAAAPATVDIAAGTAEAADAPGDAAGDVAPGAAPGAAATCTSTPAAASAAAAGLSGIAIDYNSESILASASVAS